MSKKFDISNDSPLFILCFYGLRVRIRIAKDGNNEVEKKNCGGGYAEQGDDQRRGYV